MNKKIPKVGVRARTQIAQTLPLALDKAISSYHDFLDNPDGAEANEFKNRHTAYKAALAHIELLLKLADMVEMPDEDMGNGLAEILKNAKKELENVR